MTETMDERSTTGTSPRPVVRSGWTTYDAVVQRQILTSVHTAAGEFTTVNIMKMLLFGVKLVCTCVYVQCLSSRRSW